MVSHNVCCTINFVLWTNSDLTQTPLWRLSSLGSAPDWKQSVQPTLGRPCVLGSKKWNCICYDVDGYAYIKNKINRS